jgi:hypothetical protein
VEGKVWECVVPSTELNAAKARWMVSGTTRRSDGVHVRVIADSAPCPNAQALAPTLEDAYLLKITGSRVAQNGAT